LATIRSQSFTTGGIYLYGQLGLEANTLHAEIKTTSAGEKGPNASHRSSIAAVTGKSDTARRDASHTPLTW